jgi:hypothetical protein
MASFNANLNFCSILCEVDHVNREWSSAIDNFYDHLELDHISHGMGNNNQISQINRKFGGFIELGKEQHQTYPSEVLGHSKLSRLIPCQNRDKEMRHVDVSFWEISKSFEVRHQQIQDKIRAEHDKQTEARDVMRTQNNSLTTQLYKELGRLELLYIVDKNSSKQFIVSQWEKQRLCAFGSSHQRQQHHQHRQQHLASLLELRFSQYEAIVSVQVSNGSMSVKSVPLQRIHSCIRKAMTIRRKQSAVQKNLTAMKKYLLQLEYYLE